MKWYQVDLDYHIDLGIRLASPSASSFGKVIQEVSVVKETKEYLFLLRKNGVVKVKKTHSPSGYDPFVYKPTKKEAIEFAENYFNEELKEALKRVEIIKEKLAEIQKEKENEN